MPFIRIQQQQLFYTRQPWVVDKSRPALLLVHGAGGTHLDWPAQLRQLEGAMVYGLDLPGHGRSEKPGRRAVADYAADVVAFCETLQLEQVVLAGHSMGGAIAQTVGCQRPDWLAGLVLVGTGARLRVTDAILHQILPHFETTVDSITRFYWAAGASPALVEAGRLALRQNDPQVLYDDYAACNLFDLTAQLSRIEAPTLVISGTADQLTPLKYGRFLAEHIPNAELLILEGAAHMMALEQPATVAAAVQSFIRKVTRKQQ